MNAPSSTIDQRVIQLLPRLSSDNDGEVVATVRAINRLLSKADTDWHDFCERCTAQLSEHGGQTLPSSTANLTAFLIESERRLYGCEPDFVRNLHAQLVSDPEWQPSAKQLRWLNRIYARVSSGVHHGN